LFLAGGARATFLHRVPRPFLDQNGLNRPFF
jgi:hypothetical protein